MVLRLTILNIMRTILNLICVIIVTILLSMTSSILFPILIPDALIIGIVALSVMFTMLIFMCKNYQDKYKKHKKHYTAMYDHLQNTIIERDKMIQDLLQELMKERRKRKTDNDSLINLLNFMSPLVDELEQAKEMIDDLAKANKKLTDKQSKKQQ
jgi:glucan phosphoethanolaminetransferase (alkaline phosphatase superfamily)